MAGITLSLYLAAARVAQPLWALSLRRRVQRGKEDASRLDERYGRSPVPRPAGTVLWLHALGIGEAGAMLSLIRGVRAQRPGTTVLLTTNTRTGADGLARLGLPDGVIHTYAPIDTPAAVTRFLDHWRPDAFVLAELDLWPLMLCHLSARQIPMAIVNARLTDRRFAGRMRVRSLFASLFPLFRTILVQDRTTADRMVALGGRTGQVGVAGLLKAAADPLPDRPEDRAALEPAVQQRPVWLAASTEAREHAAVLAAQAQILRHHPQALLILAPRQPKDADAAAEMALSTFGQPARRRSKGQSPTTDSPVFLADSMGEMGLWYRLAPVTFVGHSLDLPGDRPLTGKNPFEAALLGSVVVHGPCTGNFAESYQALSEAGASVAIDDPEAMAKAVMALWANPADRVARITAANEVLDAARGALPITLEAVLGLLDEARGVQDL